MILNPLSLLVVGFGKFVRLKDEELGFFRDRADVSQESRTSSDWAVRIVTGWPFRAMKVLGLMEDMDFREFGWGRRSEPI